MSQIDEPANCDGESTVVWVTTHPLDLERLVEEGFEFDQVKGFNRRFQVNGGVVKALLDEQGDTGVNESDLEDLARKIGATHTGDDRARFTRSNGPKKGDLLVYVTDWNDRTSRSAAKIVAVIAKSPSDKPNALPTRK